MPNQETGDDAPPSPASTGPARTEPSRTEDLVFRAARADDMKQLGRRLGQAMQVGDVVGLVGALGAGKTTLAQGIAQGIDVRADRHVASPTFALVNEHPGRIPFVHADLYRLRNQSELAELGLDDIFDRAAVVVEWVDLFPAAVPADYLRITITAVGDDVRMLSVSPTGPVAKRLAAVLTSK
jgi:tRNA threonylcarbamoyladenosine biosynthesis protein TsaE